MIAAMHKRTKIGCEQLVQGAINKCPIPAIQNYIKKNYTKNTQQWALWARQHLSMLLQVSSTNPLESYHSELKRLTSSLHGLIGTSVSYFLLFLLISCLFIHYLLVYLVYRCILFVHLPIDLPVCLFVCSFT